MTALLTTALIAHVVLGLIAVGASVATFVAMLRAQINLVWLRWNAVGANALYLLSWLAGGYYYVVYYGASVKPVIKADASPWAHAIVMEAKEHVFLLLPVLSAVIAYACWHLGQEIAADAKLRRTMLWLTGLTASLGITIALMGAGISGAVSSLPN